MILVDTSVWIDHLRSPNGVMTRRLRSGDVVTHSMVIGELACGNLPNRDATMALLAGIPKLDELTNAAVIAKIEENQMMGCGIGFVDAHLVCAVSAQKGARLWSRDRRLQRVAEELGVAFVEDETGEEDD